MADLVSGCAEEESMGDEFSLSVTISMLGARGVGKTSMIAAMRDQFERVFDDPNLQLIPGEQTGVDLQKLLIELKRAATGRPGYVDTSRYGIKRTTDREEHVLALVHMPTRAEVSLCWVDYPGNWLEERPADVTQMLEDAAIILVAIDTPALMEHNDAEHEEINRPDSISSALQRALTRQPDRPRLVLFVPVRSERWLTNHTWSQMRDRFQERYYKILRALKGAQTQVAAVFCPIQTLGSVQFSHYAGERPMFERVGTSYAPMDCDQPLRYSLAFVLHLLTNRAIELTDQAEQDVNNRGMMETVWDWVCEKFGFPIEEVERRKRWEERTGALRQLVQRYTAGCKREAPFEILQARNLLGI
jgi:hypothetical protein